MLTRAEKTKIIEDFTDRFQRQKIAIFSDFQGISVARLTGLRRLLKQAEAEYKVVKKTLLDRALAAAGIGVKTKELKGEIGIAFGYYDQAAPAKTLLRFSRENETFKILGGILGGKILSQQEILVLARLPSQDVLLAQLRNALVSPLRGLDVVLGGDMRNLVVVLNKIKANRA